MPLRPIARSLRMPPRALAIPLGCLLLVSGATLRAAEAPAPLPEPEADAVIERLLERQQDLTRVRARVTTTKEGGAFREARVSRGLLRAAYPDKVLFTSLPEAEAEAGAADPGFVLIDGLFLWEAQPQAEGRPQLVERRRLEREEGGAAPLGDLAAFLLGVEITSAGELRQEFDVTVTPAETPGGAAAWEVRLRPHAERDARDIALWVAEGAALPWKTRIRSQTVVYRPGVPPEERPTRESVETTELSDVATNGDGLEPFSPETFLFPLRRDMTVQDEDGAEIPPERLRTDLDRVRAHLEGGGVSRDPQPREDGAWE